ncbi:LCP family protein [Pseudonocardia lacus]|uniref:LCP family protein n=1 Tax=Pseudonocardia lacus TaxID=2835865 RepID=UPI00202881E7|nr:LCP family protein [Pseudonocardia lacus]
MSEQSSETMSEQSTAVPQDVAPVPPARRARRSRRVLVGVVIAVLVLLAAAAGAVFVVAEKLAGNIARVPGVFVPLDEASRPPATGATTFLLVGTDTRSDDPTTGAAATEPAAGRSDVLMLARVRPDGTAASVVSIPRDSWVEIPGHGPNKINAAYAFGGPSLLVQTVEQVTGVRVDHFAVIDFAGFRAMVDAVGGIYVSVSAPTSHDGVDFRQGVNFLDGEQALAFVRQREGLPGGDLDRAQRQQAALRALLTQASSSGMLTDPVGLYALLDATTRSVSVDDTLTNGGLRSLAIEMSGLRPHAITFLRAPVAGFGHEGEQAVVYLDDQQAAELWSALRDDRVGVYADRHPDDQLGSVTR